MIKNFFDGKIIAITGGTGSFGKTILKRLLSYKVKEIRIISRDEQKHVRLLRNFKDKRIVSLVGDVRDYNTMLRYFNKVDYVFHAAAIKHVPIAEEHCWEAIQTNIIGANNCLMAADINNVKRFISISTDKAVEPVNAMGMTKAVQEKLIFSYRPMSDMLISCVRYGNVLASNGSVVPFFFNLLEAGAKELPITHMEMTRFILTLEQAIDLVIYGIVNMKNKDLFVSDIPSLEIKRLAEIMLENFGGGKLKDVGIRRGEKIHETLLSSEELTKANYEFSEELNSNFYRVSYNSENQNQAIPLNSNTCRRMTDLEILTLLKEQGYYK